MNRRRFLVGAGATAVGSSALVGARAFTRVESQRHVKIDIAEDPDAYVGLDECENKPNNSFADLDDDGHLRIDMSASNPTDEGGEGVNSDSQSYFHNVFEICNQGKKNAIIWIEAEPAYETDDGYGDAVQFYWDSRPDARIDGEDNYFDLNVGQCICVGIKSDTKGLSEGQSLLEDDEIVIHATTDH